VFTGIVEELGSVVALDAPEGAALDGAARLTVAGRQVTGDARPGDSISVNGVCLTVVELHDGAFTADVMQETLRRSGLGGLAAGDPVNLERAVTPATRLGGHLVQGHVDGVGTVLERVPGRNWELVRIGLPAGLARYVVEKGSIGVDGVSLTVVEITDDSFTVSLVPTTLQRTTLGRRTPGDPVNLEVDVLAKYAEKLLAGRTGEVAR
jgi:riboflavin synthase